MNVTCLFNFGKCLRLKYQNKTGSWSGKSVFAYRSISLRMHLPALEAPSFDGYAIWGHDSHNPAGMHGRLHGWQGVWSLPMALSLFSRLQLASTTLVCAKPISDARSCIAHNLVRINPLCSCCARLQGYGHGWLFTFQWSTINWLVYDMQLDGMTSRYDPHIIS